MAFDVLITGGWIVDGSGSPWFHGDVALSGDRITDIAPPGMLPREQAAEVVDATGHVVCPGFIDIQSHSIAPLMSDPRSLSKVTQGVTTEIMGELWSPTPFGGRRERMFGWGELPGDIEEITAGWTRFRHWLEWLEQRGVAVNVGSFVGGGTVREYAKGWDAGDPTPDELELMRRVTAEAMEDGAFGIATALIYPPNSYSPPHELVEMARVVAGYGGLYVTHLRSEGDRFLQALEEKLHLGRETGCPVEVYHLKATGESNWPKMEQAIARINQARAEGVDVTADMYPYVASGTGLTVLLPDWVAEGGKLFERLDDPLLRPVILREMRGEGGEPLEGLASSKSRDRSYVVPLGFKLPEHREFVGLNLEEIAARRGQDWAECAIDLLRAERHRIGTVFFTMSEENLRLQLRQPWIKISTDAGGIDPAGQTNPVHPRAYGTYPRVLGKYVREEGVLRVEEAIRIMSGAVADRLNLRDRGHLRQGAFADVVVFDPATVGDRATFKEPHQLSVGIRDVWVNGGRVLRDGAHTGATPGRAVWGAGTR